ncbi:hypothetical protein CWI75_13970 [Kineobactrum sediminis]|uniref:TonB C-terminal domain-containing protein n=2 Tax=Kineobactrum sediminis TaxID=1905677 RepID=A0A2N5Y0D1_9GAMM|nr:hypothetical protein CWI75_13970 [Kineobactrum sediminis]
MRLHARTLLFASALLAGPGFADTGITGEAATSIQPGLADSGRDIALQADQQQQLRRTITALESEYGAYGPALPEQLLSLGLSLQQEGRHGDAIAVFKRGTHLARVTSGLYSTEQIPLLQSEVASLTALKDYLGADQRQDYLYRVQMRALSDPAQRTRALLQHARWQGQAYIHAIDEEPAQRLLQMWELNRLALNAILEEEGDQSPALLEPLHEMLRAHYLISDYQLQSGSGTGHGFNDRGGRRLTGYRKDNYDQGRALLKAIHNLEQIHRQPGADTPALTLVMLGDWMLWHQKHEEAFAVYRQAIEELVADDGAELSAARFLGKPEALPATMASDPLSPRASTSSGDVVLEFTVSAEGRVSNLNRLDDNSNANGFANRLMRRLRQTLFRPRFDLATGEPLATEKLTLAYDSKQ